MNPITPKNEMKKKERIILTALEVEVQNTIIH